MSAAFRCDRCGKLNLGHSEFKAYLHDGGGLTEVRKYSFEYCGNCSSQVKAFFNNEVQSR